MFMRPEQVRSTDHVANLRGSRWWGGGRQGGAACSGRGRAPTMSLLMLQHHRTSVGSVAGWLASCTVRCSLRASAGELRGPRSLTCGG